MRVLLALLLLGSSMAFAQQTRSDVPDASRSVPPTAADQALLPGRWLFEFGFASAVGEVGLAYTRQLSDSFALEGAVGYGWTGAQLSVMPKLTLGSAHDRFVSGAGLSLSLPGPKLESGERIPVVWFNVDALGYEHRAASGFVFSLAIGTTTSLAEGITAAVDENNAGSVNLKWYTVPQFRLGLGFSR